MRSQRYFGRDVVLEKKLLFTDRGIQGCKLSNIRMSESRLATIALISPDLHDDRPYQQQFTTRNQRFFHPGYGASDIAYWSLIHVLCSCIRVSSLGGGNPDLYKGCDKALRSNPTKWLRYIYVGK